MSTITLCTSDQSDSLMAIWETAQQNHGGANVAVKFLLSLYNGQRFPFDLTEFRRLDAQLFRHCLTVLVMDWQPQAEVHILIARMLCKSTSAVRYRFESLAHDWRLKGRCTKAELEEIRPRSPA